MRILVINPNSTASMTRSIEEAARTAARADTLITAVNPHDTPSAIQGEQDGIAALPGLNRIFDEYILGKGGYDACVVACFDDTGLIPLRRRSPIPVIGIGEAAFHAAMLVGEYFSVITTLGVSVPVIEANLDAYGFSGRCRKVRASEIPVLDLETDKEGSCDVIAGEIGQALRDDKPDAIVLGCAGMADLALILSERFRLPVIDGVAAAISFAEALRASNADRWAGSGRGHMVA